MNEDIVSSLHVKTKLAQFGLICKDPERLENGARVLGLDVHRNQGRPSLYIFSSLILFYIFSIFAGIKFKVIKTLVIVVTIFVLCWLPLHVFFLILDFHPTSQTILGPKVTSIYLGVHWLAMSNSFANPIIYGFTNESFRVDLVNLCARAFPCCICLKKLMRRKISMSTYDTVVFRRQSAIHYMGRNRVMLTRTAPNGSIRPHLQTQKFHTIDMCMEELN